LQPALSPRHPLPMKLPNIRHFILLLCCCWTLNTQISARSQAGCLCAPNPQLACKCKREDNACTIVQTFEHHNEKLGRERTLQLQAVDLALLNLLLCDARLCCSRAGFTRCQQQPRGRIRRRARGLHWIDFPAERYHQRLRKRPGL
jgi:hypothetical protein